MILFITKKNSTYGLEYGKTRQSGLFVSTSYVVQALRERGLQAEVVEAIDNNCIDRLVSLYKPKAVIIEALWVVPEKFMELRRLHPKVSWYVHLHSNIPFLAMEGIAIEWLMQYPLFGAKIIANSLECYEALSSILRTECLRLLPNVYKPGLRKPKHHKKPWLDIACFGAIRPMKNQLIQAIAAIEFAQRVGKKLNFHMNGTRIETGGDPVLKNIKALFKGERAKLVLHPWMNPHDLRSFLSRMDIGMQVSLTETFNIVTADYVAAGIPIVASNAIPWVSSFSKADTESVSDIVSKMNIAVNHKCLVRLNQWKLRRFSDHAENMWAEFARSRA